MRPALPFARHSAVLVLAILVPLVLPVVIPHAALPARRELYSAAPTSAGPGPFAWIERQVFLEREPIDILFAGSSRLWSAIDTPAVQTALSQKANRSAVVRSLGWTRAGYDALYFIVKDLLDHRRVRVLVIYDEHFEKNGVHPLAHRWYRYADEPAALEGLPIEGAAGLYAASVLQVPRTLLSLLRPNGPVDPAPLSQSDWERTYRADNPEPMLGALAARIGYDYNSVFEEFNPPRPATRAVVYSRDKGSLFSFTGETTPPYKRTFLERLVTLTAERGTKLVFLDTPGFDERRNRQVTERLCWPCDLPEHVRLVGVPPADLFGGLSDDAVSRLYYNGSHFNLNGQRYFTPVVTPALFHILDE